MLKKIAIIVSLVSVVGCASNTKESYYAVTPVVEKVNYIQPSRASSAYRYKIGNDPALERAFNQYIKTGKAPNIITAGFISFAYNKNQQPIVHTSPLQETIISLEPGERFTNVTTGDPNRWSYSAAISGSGNKQQYNILVKPSMADLATNMVITTDKRIYNLKLISSDNGNLTKAVSFWYPEDIVNEVNNEMVTTSEDKVISQSSQVNLTNLNFNYSISTKGFFIAAPAWKPVRVFDDGIHTYIEFPASMTNRDMPVLFIQKNNNQQLVNYRVKKPYFVVDKIFDQAVLVMGVGSDQSKVFITNRSYL